MTQDEKVDLAWIVAYVVSHAGLGRLDLQDEEYAYIASADITGCLGNRKLRNGSAYQGEPAGESESLCCWRSDTFRSSSVPAPAWGQRCA